MKTLSKAAITFSMIVAISSFAQTATNEDFHGAVQEGKRVFANLGSGQTFKDQVLQSNADIQVDWIRHKSIATSVGKSGSSSDGLEPSLQEAISASDRVVIATVVRNVSAETNRHNFIFTVSELTVIEDVKSNDGMKEQTPLIIWPGGYSSEGGHNVTFTVSDSRPLVVGHDYIFMLRHTQRPGVYIVDGSNSFDLSLPKIEAVEPYNSRVSAGFKGDRQTAIAALRINAHKVEGRKH